MRSTISTSVTYTPAEELEAIESIIVNPYRCSVLIIYQSTLDQKVTVFTEDPCG
jgi:hypothetical protein